MESNSRRSEKRAYSNFINSSTERSIDPFKYKCPSCGTFMQLKTEEEVFGKGEWQKREYLVCDKCDVRGKVKKSKSGNYYILSVPTGPKTRALRSEVHYYTGILEDTGVFTKDTLYNWLSTQLGYQVYFEKMQRHIGEFDEGLCERSIELCIDELLRHPDKITRPVKPYDGSRFGSYTSTRKDLLDKLASIGKEH